MTEREVTGAELVRTPHAELVPQTESEFFAELERRDKAFGKILNYAIAATHKEQWTDLGGKPWPTGPACEAMARRCRVSWTGVESEKSKGHDERGDYYSWTYRARFSCGPNDSIEAEGHCSSRDSFLGTGTGLGEDAKRDPWEVDEGNIRQAAMTNMIVNGVTRLLGVRNVSWDRLTQLLGAGRDEFAKAEFKAGAKGGGRGQTARDVEIKFGKGKGKMLSELSDDDVRWYMGVYEKDLADPNKAKYHANTRKNLEIAQAILAARAKPAAGNGHATPWATIKALPEAQGIPEKDFAAVVKSATGKANAKDLTPEDVEKVRGALREQTAASEGGFDEGEDVAQ